MNTGVIQYNLIVLCEVIFFDFYCLTDTMPLNYIQHTMKGKIFFVLLLSLVCSGVLLAV